MARVVFMGTPDFAVPSLAVLANGEYEIVGVFTREDRPAGRGQKLEQSRVKQYALSHGLPIFQPRTLRSTDEQAALTALRPDIAVVAAYGLILPQAVLDIPVRGCVNVHGSLLPRHRGAAPIAAAILAGDSEAGISIMLMDDGVDTGPVLGAAAIRIEEADTTGSLTRKLANVGAELLRRTLPQWLDGTITPQPQPANGATYAPRIEKEAGRIRWTADAEAIARQVRAFNPWPSAFTQWSAQVLKVHRARAGAGPAGTPGTVVTGGKGQAGVITGDGVLWLEEVQLPGRRALPIAAFLAGAHDFVGGVLR